MSWGLFGVAKASGEELPRLLRQRGSIGDGVAVAMSTSRPPRLCGGLKC